MGQDILYNIFLTEQRATESQVCLGSHAARGDYGGVTRLEWFGLASMLRMMAVVVVARLSDARGGGGSARTMRAQRAGGAAGTSQQLLYEPRTPNTIYLNCSRANKTRMGSSSSSSSKGVQE